MIKDKKFLHVLFSITFVCCFSMPAKTIGITEAIEKVEEHQKAGSLTEDQAAELIKYLEKKRQEKKETIRDDEFERLIKKPSALKEEEAEEEKKPEPEEKRGYGAALYDWGARGLSGIGSGASWAGSKLYEGGAWAASGVMGLTKTALTIADLVSKMSEEDEYCRKLAQVRTGTTIPDQEQYFVKQRLPKVTEALETFLGEKIPPEAAPTIGICFSGGGYRAMIETIGFLMGADALGILNAATYTSGLSGSSWALFPWVASGAPLRQYRKQLISKINKPFKEQFTPKTLNVIETIIMLVKKWIDENHIGPVDLFGALLGNVLLEGIETETKMLQGGLSLSSLAKKPQMQNADFPLPIATTVRGGEKHDLWFEFTPYEMGSHQLKAFVPSWAWGRTFENGVSVAKKSPANKIAPHIRKLVPLIADKLERRDVQLQKEYGDFFGREQTLSYCMGIGGSAFAVDFATIMAEFSNYIKDAIPSLARLQSLERFVSQSIVGLAQIYLVNKELVTEETVAQAQKESFGAATIPNFTYKMRSLMRDMPESNTPNFQLVDGGFDYIDVGGGKKENVNIGIIPLLRPERKVDVIMVCDSSGQLPAPGALRAAEARAKSLGLPFPPIDYDQITPDTLINVFEDTENPSKPIVMYLRCIKNTRYHPDFDPTAADFTGTTNFYYTKNQTKQLSNLARQNFMESKDAIEKVLRKVIIRKKEENESRWWPFIKKKASGWFGE